MGFTKRNISLLNKEGNTFALQLFGQAPAGICGTVLAPHQAKDTAELEGVQRRTTKTVLSLRNKHYDERLSTLDMFFLEKRRLQGKQIQCFRISNDFPSVDKSKLFMIDDILRTRDNSTKQMSKINTDHQNFLP